MARYNLPCPKCGEDANNANANATISSEKMVLREKVCSNGHHFITAEIILDHTTLTWGDNVLK